MTVGFTSKTVCVEVFISWNRFSHIMKSKNLLRYLSFSVHDSFWRESEVIRGLSILIPRKAVEEVVKIPKFKVLKMYRNKVWIQPLYSVHHEVFWCSNLTFRRSKYITILGNLLFERFSWWCHWWRLFDLCWTCYYPNEFFHVQKLTSYFWLFKY